MIRQTNLAIAGLALAALVPTLAHAGPYSIEFGAGAAIPTLALDQNTNVSSSRLLDRQAHKATLSPYVSVERSLPHDWDVRLTYRNFGQTSAASNPQLNFPIVCDSPVVPVCVMPDYVVLMQGQRLSYSAQAAYLGFGRTIPLGKVPFVEVSGEAGLARINASGLSQPLGGVYPARAKINGTWGLGAGIGVHLHARVSLIGRVTFDDLGRAETGSGDTMTGGGTLSVHPNEISTTLGLRFAL